MGHAIVRLTCYCVLDYLFECIRMHFQTLTTELLRVARYVRQNNFFLLKHVESSKHGVVIKIIEIQLLFLSRISTSWYTNVYTSLIDIIRKEWFNKKKTNKSF